MDIMDISILYNGGGGWILMDIMLKLNFHL